MNILILKNINLDSNGRYNNTSHFRDTRKKKDKF